MQRAGQQRRQPARGMAAGTGGGGGKRQGVRRPQATSGDLRGPGEAGTEAERQAPPWQRQRLVVLSVAQLTRLAYRHTVLTFTPLPPP